MAAPCGRACRWPSAATAPAPRTPTVPCNLVISLSGTSSSPLCLPSSLLSLRCTPLAFSLFPLFRPPPLPHSLPTLPASWPLRSPPTRSDTPAPSPADLSVLDTRSARLSHTSPCLLSDTAARRSPLPANPAHTSPHSASHLHSTLARLLLLRHKSLLLSQSPPLLLSLPHTSACCSTLAQSPLASLAP